MRKTTTAAAVNGLKHGLTARTIAIPGLEEHGDWLNFREAILQSLVPDGALETELAMRIAELLWRGRRVARAEQQSVDARRRLETVTLAHKKENPIEVPPDNFYASAFNFHTETDQIVAEKMLPDGDTLDKILRYEAHLSRQLYHAMHQLEAIQARRRGEATPLARVSVTGLPGS